MLRGGDRPDDPHIDEHLRPVRLDPADRAALIEFLRALTPSDASTERPALP